MAPKWESMYVHGMLHRIEGDITNTRAWYGNVAGSEVFKSVWADGQDERNGNGNGNGNDGEEGKVPVIAKLGWEVFLDRLEGFRDRTKKRREIRRNGRTNRRRESGSSESAMRTESASTSAEVSSEKGLDSKGAGNSVTRDAELSRNDIRTDPETINWGEEERLLAETSLWEILRVLRFCEQKFGTGSLDVQGAKSEFLGRIESGDERLAKIAEGMITGGEGWRVW